MDTFVDTLMDSKGLDGTFSRKKKLERGKIERNICWDTFVFAKLLFQVFSIFCVGTVG